MKKIISAVLTAALLATLLTGAAFAAAGLENFTKVNTYNNGRFSDVSAGDWFNENVKNAYELGLMQGKGANAFAPNENVTLAETVALAARIHSIYNTGAANFAEGAPWYAVYYDYAVENGIINSAQYTNYEAAASRDQFVRILVKALPDSAMAVKNNIAANSISDVEYSTAAHVYTFYRAGILTGKDDAGKFYPADKILRSEVAAVVSRMAVPALRVEFSIKPGGETGPDGSLLSNVSLGIKALSEGQKAFALALADPPLALVYLAQSMTYTLKAREYIQAVCDATKDDADQSKVYEYASTALEACTEAARNLQKGGSPSATTEMFAVAYKALEKAFELII